MLLVMALVVAFAALSWPIMEGSIDSVRLRSGADRVRTACDHARLSAMTEGTIYVFRFQPGTDRYQVGPWEQVASSTATGQVRGGIDETQATGRPAAVTSSSAIPIDSAVVGQQIDGRLPEGIRFGAAVHQDETGAAGADAELQAPLDADTILFYPDGTTSDVSLSLSSERQLLVVVSLRGVTGASSVSELTTADELAR
ncbi:MAG: hypothetical protein A2W31_01815 [Planctomycetes bacterium RBG_16_64_10]|nr:MAG: hypothetical protein A2W31_01815 [Planctomycetes bacterium RBG_16_64_10]